ncbi:MAG: Calx-beta domain-containing protein [Chitinophagales bacterium]
MKKYFFTLLSIIICNVFSTQIIFAQKAVIIGLNHEAPDGIAFVAGEDILSGTAIYFTENEYDSSTHSFIDVTSESVIKWTAPSGGVNKGDVIFVKEISTNTFSIACTNGSGASTCGTIQHLGGTFGISATGEVYYAYADTDDNLANGFTEIYSVIFTGEAFVSSTGGNIPSSLSPASDYPDAIIVDGFPVIANDEFHNRVEYNPINRTATIGVTELEDPSNYLHGEANADLSTNPFTNLTIGSVTPSVSIDNVSIEEGNGSGNTVFTFTVSRNENTTAFSVNYATSNGNAIAGTDYTAKSGTINFTSGGSLSASITINVSRDDDFEVHETFSVTLSNVTNGVEIANAVGQGTILNDDTSNSQPKIAIIGLNHENPDGFSFVATEDLCSGTTIYFTDRDFDKANLQFNVTIESILKWEAPSSGITKGDVVYIEETGTNVFSVACTDGSGTCGTVTYIGGTFGISAEGEAFYAYADTNDDPNDGFIDLYAVLYSGDNDSGTPGGNLTSNENPSSIFTNAIVIQGFPNTNANRMEFDPTKRSQAIGKSALETTSNWLHAQANQDLSVVAFTNLTYTSSSPEATIAVSNSPLNEDASGTINFTITLSSNAITNIDIGFTISGTANDVTDYSVGGSGVSYNTTSNTGIATIPTNSNSVLITIDPTANSTMEADKTIVLTINAGTCYDIGTPNTVSGTIADDDVPVVSIAPITSTVSENSGSNLVYRFTRTGLTTTTLMVNFSIAGTAADGDYSVATDGTGLVTYSVGTNTGTITFPVNSSTVDLTVTPAGDTDIEADETVVVNIENP